MRWMEEPMRRDLMKAEASLKWASEGEFSASITPSQAQALRAELEWLRAGSVARHPAEPRWPKPNTHEPPPFLPPPSDPPPKPLDAAQSVLPPPGYEA